MTPFGPYATFADIEFPSERETQIQAAELHQQLDRVLRRYHQAREYLTGLGDGTVTPAADEPRQLELEEVA